MKQPGPPLRQPSAKTLSRNMDHRPREKRAPAIQPLATIRCSVPSPLHSLFSGTLQTADHLAVDRAPMRQSLCSEDENREMLGRHRGSRCPVPRYSPTPPSLPVSGPRRNTETRPTRQGGIPESRDRRGILGKLDGMRAAAKPARAAAGTRVRTRVQEPSLRSRQRPPDAPGPCPQIACTPYARRVRLRRSVRCVAWPR